MRLVVTASLLAGCASDAALNEQDSPVPDVPSPYLVEDTGTEEIPTLAPEIVQRGVQSVVDEVFSYDPMLIFQAQQAAYAAGDGDCPYVYDDYLDLYGYYYWYDTCSASNGSTFDGYSYYVDLEDQDGGYYVYDDYHTFYGLTDIYTAAGERYEQTGQASYYNTDYYAYGYRYVSWYISGDFIWTGASFGDTWLGADMSMQLSGYGYQYDNDGGTLLSLEGTVGGLAGDFDSVAFTGLFAMDEAIGNDCPEPGGTVSIREASTGEWYDVEFQGPSYWGAGTFPPECDGCGDVYHRGDWLGQACPDLTTLTRWKEQPWH